MKKFIYSFAVIAALGLVACGGNKNEEANAEEVVTEEAAAVVEEAPVAESDTTNCCKADSCQEVAAEPAAEVAE